jgi:hypothetical protein
MEAATKAVANGDSLLCDNVPVVLVKRNDKYYGKLYLDLAFCKRRCIKLFNNSKDGEDETSDYMCIRYNTGQVRARRLLSYQIGLMSVLYMIIIIDAECSLILDTCLAMLDFLSLTLIFSLKFSTTIDEVIHVFSHLGAHLFIDKTVD